jgi:hypothetical protein
VVRDVLAITGGIISTGVFSKTWSLVTSGGVECLNHGLPDLPVAVEGLSVAQAHDRFIYACGGRDAANGERCIPLRSLSNFWRLF